MRNLVIRVGGAAVAVSIVGCLVVPIGGGGGSVVIESERPVVSGAAAVAAFAAGLAPRLASVLDQLATRRRGLPPAASADFPEEARRLVEEGADAVLDILEDPRLTAGLEGGAGELAPLRDYVRAAETAALDELSESRSAFRPPLGPAPAVDRGALADLRWAQNSDPPAGTGPVDRFLGALATFGSRARRSELRTTFCALRPTGGRFVLFPASARDRQDVIHPAGTLANVWRGTYRYTVSIGKLSTLEANLDLMEPERLTLDCPVEGGTIACRHVPGLSLGCPR